MRKRKSKNAGIAGYRMYVRHHCAKCNSRIFPFDKFESDTEAPDPGKRGKPILLTSSNHDPENRTAWCWSCQRFVWAVRITEREIHAMYIKRRGVVIRSKR